MLRRRILALLDALRNQLRALSEDSIEPNLTRVRLEAQISILERLLEK